MALGEERKKKNVCPLNGLEEMSLIMKLHDIYHNTLFLFDNPILATLAKLKRLCLREGERGGFVVCEGSRTGDWGRETGEDESG